MTARENMLRALRREETDRMPFLFAIDNFNHPDSLPPALLDPFDMVKIQRHVGGDLLDRLGPTPVAENHHLLKHTSTDLGAGSRLEEWEMPEGKLTGRYRASTEAGTCFLEEHCIIDTHGYEVLQALVEDADVSVDPAGVEAAGARLAEIGDDGMMYTVGPASPLMDLTRMWVGLERFVYDLMDHREVVEKTMDVMARKCYEHYELLAASTPARAIVYWDDANASYISVDMLEKYVIPFYRNVADICHSHGKLLVCHTCGRIKDFLAAFADSGIDAIDWVAPPDTGDVIFSEAQTVLGDKVAMLGTVVPSVMRFGTPDAVENHIHQVLAGVDRWNGFLFMIPAPIGSPMRNVERAREVVETRYRSRVG